MLGGSSLLQRRMQTSSRMKVLVSGGTGFIGRNVVRRLVAAGHEPRVLVRDVESGKARALAADLKAVLVAGDIHDETALNAAVVGVDAVIHLVGIISEIGRNTFEEAHVGATRRLLDAAKRAGVRRWVQMSALGTRPNARARYHQTKWDAEELVRASGLDWTIFRPSIVYGPGDGLVGLFAKMSRWSPILPVMGPGAGLMQPIHVEQVAKAFVGALTTPASIGQTYDLCGDERFRFVEILGLILKALGRRRLIVHLPMPLARLQAKVLESVFPAILRRASPLTCDQLLMLEEDNVGDAARAKADFHLDFGRFEEGIRTYLVP